MPFVFISAPYTGMDYHETQEHIAYARRIAAWCAARDIPFVCPHLNSANFDRFITGMPHEGWLALYGNILIEADAMLVGGSWERSEGCRHEMEIARATGIPVFAFDDEDNRDEFEQFWCQT